MADFLESLGFKATGLEPTDDIKTNGFQAGYKPPAAYFNWFLTGVTQRLDELAHYCKELKEAVRSEEENGKVNFSDLNNCVEVGMYTYSLGNASKIANRPEPSVKVQTTVLTLPRLTDYDKFNLIQIAVTSSNMVYVRNKQDNVWTNWQEVFTSADVSGVRGKLGLPVSCVRITNWNDATKTGWYMGSNEVDGKYVDKTATNAPTGSTSTVVWYFGYVLAHNTDYVYQEVYQFTASTDAKLIPKYIRARASGNWGAWTDVTVQRNVPYEAKLDYIKTLTSDAQTQLNNKMSVTPRRIEFTSEAGAGDGGYLDFHFEGSTEDFTSRIIESHEGVLSFLCDKGSFRGDVTVHGGYPVYSTKDVIPIEHGGTGASDVVNARKNLNSGIRGSYTGTNESSSDTSVNRMAYFDTGARGSNLLMIVGKSYVGWLTPMGGFMIEHTNRTYFGLVQTFERYDTKSDHTAYYENGYIRLLTSSNFINGNEFEYEYVCM